MQTHPSVVTGADLDALWRSAASIYAASEAFRFQEGGSWRSLTYAEVDDSIDGYAARLAEVGVRPGDRVAIAAHLGRQAVLADLSVTLSGAVSVPLPPGSTARQLAMMITDSGASTLIVESLEQLERLESVAAELPALNAVLLLAGQLPATCSWPVRLFTEVDGADGRSRAVMVSHDNLVAASASCAEALAVCSTDRQLVFHPLAHIFSRLLLWTALRNGACTVLGRGSFSVMADLAETKPTIFVGVPMVYEKAMASFVSDMVGQGALRRRALDAVRALGRVDRDAESGWFKRQLALLIAAPLQRQLRERLGGRIRLLISGGAPLTSATEELFDGCGLPILQGYGLSEACSAVTLNRPGAHEVGTVGPPLPGVEVMFDTDGELLVRGRAVAAGYWNQSGPETIVITDGWLRTGDIAELLPSGALRVTDRKKDIIVTASGRRVSPVRIEAALREIPLLSHAFVDGEGRSELVALVALDPEAALNWAADRGLGSLGLAELTRHPALFAALREAIDATNRELEPAEAVRRFAILEGGFDAASGEVTHTMTNRRSFITRKYRALLDGLYDSTKTASRPAVRV
jgi:long-chain acyl-CoA synthetase